MKNRPQIEGIATQVLHSTCSRGSSLKNRPQIEGIATRIGFVYPAYFEVIEKQTSNRRDCDDINNGTNYKDYIEKQTSNRRDCDLGFRTSSFWIAKLKNRPQIEGIATINSVLYVVLFVLLKNRPQIEGIATTIP